MGTLNTQAKIRLSFHWVALSYRCVKVVFRVANISAVVVWTLLLLHVKSLANEAQVIYQTRDTAFHRDIQTPRKELKIRGAEI